MPHLNPLSIRLLPAILANLVAAFSLLYSSTNLLTDRLRSYQKTASFGGSDYSMPVAVSHKRGEVYFLSHGGPPTMHDTRSEAYQAWKSFGRIVEASKPRGLVVVSAHWENPHHSPNVQVNDDLTNPLIFDFGGYPRHYYKDGQFISHGTEEMLQSVVGALQAGGVGVEQTSRGPDHGVWVPFKVAFNGKTNIPIIQVSLPGDSSPKSTAKLGRALSALRGQGYAIIGSGQVVHNLRDMFSGAPTPCNEPFMADTSAALTSSNPLKSTLELFNHKLFSKAHPTPEHFLPIVVPVSAADEGDRLEEIYVGLDKMGLGWGMWRWTLQEL